ncbi:MAG TPA: MFS transporter [Chloroflexi bacterium]|jgi:MFS family permease|nr:MFS transporter [Chloroflexota bacterium]
MNDPQLVAGVATAPTAGARRRAITLYTVAVFLYWVTLYLYMPTLAVYVETKTDNLAMVGVVLSMYGLWQALVRLPLGMVADWMGRRKPFIVGGLVLAGVGAIVMPLAPNVEAMIVGRAIVGLSAGTWVPLVVVFTSLFPPEQAVRASTTITTIGTVGRLLATSVTGWLNDLGGYSLAFYLAAVAAGLAVLAVLPVPEKRRPPARPSWRALGALIVRRDVLLPTLLAVLSQYVTWATAFGFIAIIADRMGATAVQQSLLLTVNLLAVTVGNLGATTVTQRLGSKALVAASIVLLAAGAAVVAVAPSLAWLFVAHALNGLSHGVSYPVLMGLSIRYVADAERTTAMGLHQAVYAIGMFAGPAISGVLADAMGIPATFGLTAAACLLLGLIGTRMLRSARADA